MGRTDTCLQAAHTSAVGHPGRSCENDLISPACIENSDAGWLPCNSGLTYSRIRSASHNR